MVSKSGIIFLEVIFNVILFITEEIMKSIVKALSFGFLTWLIPFVSAIPFYSKDGNLLIDIFLFKTIMIVIGAITGAFFLILYFKKVEENYLKEGILIGLIWFVFNFGLDVLILVPIAKLSFVEYISQIGLRYLVIPTFSITIGYLLEK